MKRTLKYIEIIYSNIVFQKKGLVQGKWTILSAIKTQKDASS